MFLTVNVDDQDSELATKSLEQQRLELQKVTTYYKCLHFTFIFNQFKFEELKDQYQIALNYIKASEIANASNVLINLYENDLFLFKVIKSKKVSIFNYIFRALKLNNYKRPS